MTLKKIVNRAKFLYNKLTGIKTPHFAIFLNDVQRKGKESKYGVSATFLPGHFLIKDVWNFTKS